ncbi:MAG: peroxiredoxin-like family protein [Saprospiraceae bacterium]|nr:peroxiredoxin-like family protein [Saprospiraceae bacterium]
MKLKIALFLMICLSIAYSGIAQLPEKPEDVSPLLIGETIPNEQVTTSDGKTVAFHDLIKEKPTVLIFYRGGWCPYCNTHLAEIGQAEAEILQLGYQIIAVSPDDVKHLQATDEKNKVNYQLVSDGKGLLATATGIAFKAPDRYGKMLAEYSDSANPGYLPVPTLMVLNTKGEILFEYIRPEYKSRISSDLLIAVLKNLDTKS